MQYARSCRCQNEEGREELDQIVLRVDFLAWQPIRSTSRGCYSHLAAVLLLRTAGKSPPAKNREWSRFDVDFCQMAAITRACYARGVGAAEVRHALAGSTCES